MTSEQLPMNRAMAMLIGFCLAVLVIVAGGQWAVIQDNERRADEARIEAEAVEKRSAERYRKMMDEFSQWRKALKRDNPEIVVPPVKSDKKDNGK